jgi:hypothetical protein
VSRVVAHLLDSADGSITQLVRRDAVEKMLTCAVRGDRADARALQQFTWLAVASEQLEPGSSRPATSATYARITAPPKPVEQPGKRWRSRLRRLKKTRLGKALGRRLR